MRAVIFDLWDTLVEYPAAESAKLTDRLAELVGMDAEEFGRLWRESYRASQTGPLADVYRSLGVPEDHVDSHVEARHAFARRALRLRHGAAMTLAALRRRGIKLAVLSVCSEDVPAAWPNTDLAGLFDVETFSSECGLMKPEPEIYLHTARGLGVAPRDCLFVGDGANDELAGAQRAGMRALLIHRPGDPPLWPEVQTWDGLRVTSIPQVLEVLEP